MIAIRQETNVAPPWRIDARAWVTQQIQPSAAGQGAKYEYHAVLEVGNPNRFAVSFDMIVFHFQRLDAGWSMWDVAEQRITFPGNKKMQTDFFYTENHEQTPREDKLKEITIPGKSPLVLPRVAIGAIRPVNDVQGPTRIVACFFRAGASIAEPLIAQLPSRSIIPCDSELVQDQKGYPLQFISEQQVC